jgi:membrane protein
MVTGQRAQRAWDILRGAVKGFIRDGCPRKAAALSYYAIFSLPPLLLIVVIAVGVVLRPAQLDAWFQGRVGEQISAEAAGEIRTMVTGAWARVQGGTILGLVLGIAGLLFGATGAFAELQRSLNEIWDVPPDSRRRGVASFLLKRVLSLGMIFLIAAVLLVFVVVSSGIAALGDRIVLPAGASPALLWLANAGVSLLVLTFLFAAIFKVLPDTEVAWRDVRVGAFVTAVLFVLGKELIGLYVGRSDPGEVYGAAAATVVVLLWVYYSAMIVFLGAELTQVRAQRRGQAIRAMAGSQSDGVSVSLPVAGSTSLSERRVRR